MSDNKALIATYDKASKLFNDVNDLLDEVAGLQKNPDELISLNSPQLPEIMSEKKKQLKLTWEDLELQTDISVSTLKRVFKEPEKSSLGNFLKVAQELGLKTWFEM